MKWMRMLSAAMLALAVSLGTAGCENEGPFEDAGEEIDDAADEVGDEIEDLGDRIDN